MKVALLLSCGSFEGYFCRVQGQTRRSYLDSYRNDWCWYYGAGLVNNGIKPILYIPSVRETGIYETDTGIDVRFLPLRKWYHPFENIWYKRLCRTNRFTLYADDCLNAEAFMGSLKEGLEEDKVEALYIQDYWNGRFDYISARVSLPLTAADHGGVSRGVVKWFKRKSFARTPFVYSQTPDECDIVRTYGGNPILQPNGCDTSQFFPRGLSRSKSVLIIARLTNKQKRISDLIEALTLLPQDWTLDIVGSGPDLELLQQHARNHEVTGRVTFHGFQTRERVQQLLSTCGVYTMPSDNEAVAIAALEAMGCGASVVLSRIRAFELLVEDGLSGRLVPVADVPKLAEAIIDAWEHRDQRGAEAVKTVREKFDSKVLYARLAQSLRDMVPDRGL